MSFGPAHSQVMTEVNTVSDYLMVTDDQQRIYVGRFLNANDELARECLGSLDAESATNRFNTWLESHPQYLRRNLTTAFTAALISACK